MSLNTLKERFQKNPIVIIILTIVAIVAFFSSIITNITTIETFIQKHYVLSGIIMGLIMLFSIIILISTSFFQKRAIVKKVEKLIPGVNISLYRDKFDVPTFSSRDEQRQIKRYIFVQPYFYLDVITNMDDTVQFFAVTVRDQSFKPTFKSPGYPSNNPSFQIQLGTSKFSDIPGFPNHAVGWIGAGYGFSYYEMHYFGNPGHYQSFGFGLNCAGYFPNTAQTHLLDIMNNTQYNFEMTSISDKDLIRLKGFRTKVAFNTYAVSAPYISIKDLAGRNLGVDYYQVRTLNP